MIHTITTMLSVSDNLFQKQITPKSSAVKKYLPLSDFFYFFHLGKNQI